VISSDEYGGWAVWSVFQVIKQSLKVARWLTGNQCKSRRMCWTNCPRCPCNNPRQC